MKNKGLRKQFDPRFLRLSRLELLLYEVKGKAEKKPKLTVKIENEMVFSLKS